MVTMPQLAGNIATYAALPSIGTAPVQTTVAEASPVNTAPYPQTEFGSATSLADPASGTDFMPAGIFDTTGATGTSILGVDMNELMAIDAALNASMMSAFTMQPMTLYSDPMIMDAVPTVGTEQTYPMAYDPTYPDTMSIAAYGDTMSQIAGYSQATAQVGMGAALYSAEMAGATAATQAQGQAAMSYMNMLA